MFDTVRNAFKVKDIRNRILFTFFMLIIIRIGSQLPIPGVDRNVFADWFANQSSDAFNFFDAVTGGSFLQMSVFALNITPYITSSIIMQLLTIAIPKLEEMQRRRKKENCRDYTLCDCCSGFNRSNCNGNRILQKRLSDR